MSLIVSSLVLLTKLESGQDLNQDNHAFTGIHSCKILLVYVPEKNPYKFLQSFTDLTKTYM